MMRFPLPVRLGRTIGDDIELLDADGYRVCLVYGENSTDAHLTALCLEAKLNSEAASPPPSPPDEIAPSEVVERLARALIDELHNLGPKELRNAVRLLEAHADDFAIHAYKRKWYRELTRLLTAEVRKP